MDYMELYAVCLAFNVRIIIITRNVSKNVNFFYTPKITISINFIWYINIINIIGFLTVITEHVKGTDCLMLLTGSRDEMLSNVFLCACVVAYM